MFIPEEEYKRIIKSFPVFCVDFLIKCQDKYLLIKRTDEPVKGVYWVIGGRMYFKETLQELAKRVQMREIGDHFSNTYPDVFKNLRKIHPEIDHLNVFNFVYNNGIVGFQDMSLKDEYAYEYFDLLYLLEMNGVKFPPEADPNIVVEQSLLTTLSQFKNAYVKELIPVDEMKKYDLFGAAERIGFVHLWGNSKYQNEYFNKVKARLKAADAKLYKEVKNKIKKI